MRGKILKKSKEMFLTLGFKSVTMDDIAKELGVSKKTIYKYFSNKFSLVEAVTESIQETIDDKIHSIKEKSYNAIEEEFAVKAIFKELFKKTKTSPAHQLKKYYPKIYTKLKERERCICRDCSIDNIEKGIQQGLYRSNIAKQLISDFYFCLIFGVFENESHSGEMHQVMKIEYEVLEYHIRAIATEKGIQELEKQLNIINQS